MDAGKLPNDLLAGLLRRIEQRDPRVLLGPGVGRDAAVIDIGGPRLLVAKSDPITFATGLIGAYAVYVNANDIACLGARPTWFLATILLPEGAPPDLAVAVFGQVLEACESLGVELIGGHTEFTHRLDRPIVVGALLGEVEREALVRPENALPGDVLILTKGIAIEGTSVLAREAAERLERLRVPAETVMRARDYLRDPGISVVAEAMAACGAARVHAMHDPTEGGLATALYELAEASGTGFEVSAGEIEVLRETRDICRAAGLDPMGLLASGALLIAVAEEDCGSVLDALQGVGVAARRIGRLTAPGPGAIIESDGGRRPVPRFARDEVARFLSEASL